MKILDRYILIQFLQTLTTVFVILFFIFILQGVWLFIAELAGKDLDIWVIVKFLLLYSPKMIPMVLPLSVLLASIMTFGSFAENYEFAAMKSSGISLQRAMKYLSVFICFLALVSFWFANNVIPKAEFEFIKLRREIVQTKPAMAIAQGQFNQIGNINIKVEKKSGENGEKLENVTMHIKATNGIGNKSIIKAKRGLLSSAENSNLLSMDLMDGNYYEDMTTKNYQDGLKQPFVKSSFDKYTLNIDLTSLNASSDDGASVNTNSMLNTTELIYTIDSLTTDLTKERNNYTAAISAPFELRYGGKLALEQVKPVEKINTTDVSKVLEHYNKEDRIRIVKLAMSFVSNTQMTMDNNEQYLFDRKKNINKHWIVLHEKFVIAFSCLLMFYIGAPLGAIIRKGGLGLPIVFAILIFIIYHFINTFGKKVAQEDGIPAWFGSWLSSIVLLPLAVFFTYRATKDLGVSINFDVVINPIKKLFTKKKNNNTNNVI